MLPCLGHREQIGLETSPLIHQGITISLEQPQEHSQAKQIVLKWKMFLFANTTVTTPWLGQFNMMTVIQAEQIETTATALLLIHQTMSSS